MAKISKIDCDNCEKCISNCCRLCLEEDTHSIFKELYDNELNLINEGKQQIKYNAGETIIKQNTASAYVLCIRQGLAKVYVEGMKDKNVLLRLVGQGDFVTGGGFFNGNIQKFTIAALTEVTCCLIDSSAITKLYSENSKFAVDILRHHTQQNNILLNTLVNHTQKYMPGRVADTLLYLKKEVYKSNAFSIHLTRKDLADMSNMTKESLVRILQQFKESKLIEVKGNHIKICDESSLESISKNG